MPATYDKDDQIIELEAEIATVKDDLMAERMAHKDTTNALLRECPTGVTSRNACRAKSIPSPSGMFGTTVEPN